jgi:hypothetical protein
MFDANKNARGEELAGDYLWDGSGAPDEEVQRLEKMLVSFRQAEELAALRIPEFVKRESSLATLVNRLWLPCFAAAVMVAFVLMANVMIRRIAVESQGSSAGWNVARIEGTPQIGKLFLVAGGAAKLRIGQTLETDADSRASIWQDDLGEMKVDPNSRVQLVQTDSNRKRIRLDVGTIHARIWAPPGQFVVDTPSAVAVDLGCAYALEVSPDGSGTIRTTMGWVGFQLNGRDSFIPAGAMCPTRPHVGPGTPYFEDAPARLKSALSELDFGGGSEDSRRESLRVVLAEARPHDALSLWHLLFRTEGADRELVYERLSELAPPPQGVRRDGVLRLQNEMLDDWWNTLGLGDISMWRYWEQSGSPSGAAAGKFMQKKVLILKQPR